jgi:succinate--hydroxymethylglutarate CoA-transferase
MSTGKKILPLQNIRVLDLSRILAGPYATMMLEDMGADVIKVERPKVGDDTRHWGPPFTPGRESSYFISANRNKRSIVIDLKKPEGISLIKDLASVSDVIIDNFAPGDAKKLGLDRDDFVKEFPRLIWCSITGYGADGPLAHRLGYAVLVEAFAGLMHCTGPKNGEPVKVGVALTDIITGLHASSAILAAIHSRNSQSKEHTALGKGIIIDCSLLESQLSAMSNIASNYLIAQQDGQRWGTEHASIVPYGALRTKDGSIVIGAANDGLFRVFCQCLKNQFLEEKDAENLAEDPQFQTNADRVQHRDILITKLETILKRKTSQEWVTIFDQVEEKNRFPFALVNNLQQVFSDPQVIHRNMIIESNHTTAGLIKMTGYPVKFPDLIDPTEVRYPPPILGEHTKEIMQQILKKSTEEIEDLLQRKIIYDR